MHDDDEKMNKERKKMNKNERFIFGFLNID